MKQKEKVFLLLLSIYEIFLVTSIDSRFFSAFSNFLQFRLQNEVLKFKFSFFSFGLHICEGNECCENLLTFSRFLGEMAASVLIFLSSLSVQWKLLNNVLVATSTGASCRDSLSRFSHTADFSVFPWSSVCFSRARADAKFRWKFRQIIDQIRKTSKWMIKRQSKL